MVAIDMVESIKIGFDLPKNRIQYFYEIKFRALRFRNSRKSVVRWHTRDPLSHVSKLSDCNQNETLSDLPAFLGRYSRIRTFVVPSRKNEQTLIKIKQFELV